MQVYLRKQVKKPAVDTRGVKRFARSVLSGEGVDSGGLTLVLTDNRRIRKLNLQFRDLDRATDVLSFPLGEEEEDGRVYLGDVVISLERAVEQAPRFDNDPERELARLITHGILHILGYDHHRPADGKRMKAAERRALAAFAPGMLFVEPSWTRNA